MIPTQSTNRAVICSYFPTKKMRIFPLPGRVGSPFRSNLQFCSLNQLEIHVCCTIFILFLRDFPPVNLEIWKSTIHRSFSEGKVSNFISVLVIDGSINLIISRFSRLTFLRPTRTEELGKWPQPSRYSLDAFVQVVTRAVSKVTLRQVRG